MCSKLLFDYIRDEGYPVATLILTLLGTTFTVIRTILILIVVYFEFAMTAAVPAHEREEKFTKKVLGSISIMIGVVSLIQGAYIWRAASKDDAHAATKGMCIGLLVFMASTVGFIVSAVRIRFVLSITFSFLFDIARVIVETYSVSQALIQYRSKPFRHNLGQSFY